MTVPYRPAFVSAAVIAELFTWDEAIAALREVYALPEAPAATPPRVVATQGPVWLRSLAAILPTGRYMGCKQFARSRAGAVSYLVSLFDQQTGELACLLDGNSLTAYRTAATSALAVDALAPGGAARLALLGSGAEAHAHLRAIASVRALRWVKVFSPTPANREGFAAFAEAELGVSCTPTASPQAAIDGATIVVAAARSRSEQPTFSSDWIEDGVLTVSIGSTLPMQREVDPGLIDRADIIVADAVDEVAHGTGDFIAARAAGVTFANKLVSLHQVIDGSTRQRLSQTKRPLFKSVGSALQDLAIAELCFLKATAAGKADLLNATFELKAPR